MAVEAVSASERAKGARGEREVVDMLRTFGIACDRTVHNSGLYLRGDVTGVDGYHLEVKRHETLRVPAWIRQAEDECGDLVPVVAFRQSRGEWYAAMPLRDLARLLADNRG
ncbi:MAG TPA: hypothetical protein VNC18_17640 [Gemmatimonadaceae bacterium]|nr:hypothetical protein [Gemmatimonadaceae bacterium]